MFLRHSGWPFYPTTPRRHPRPLQARALAKLIRLCLLLFPDHQHCRHHSCYPQDRCRRIGLVWNKGNCGHRYFPYSLPSNCSGVERVGSPATVTSSHCWLFEFCPSRWRMVAMEELGRHMRDGEGIPSRAVFRPTQICQWARREPVVELSWEVGQVEAAHDCWIEGFCPPCVGRGKYY